MLSCRSPAVKDWLTCDCARGDARERTFELLQARRDNVRRRGDMEQRFRAVDSMENGPKTRLSWKVRFRRVAVLPDEQRIMYLIERDQGSGQPAFASLVDSFAGGTVTA